MKTIISTFKIFSWALMALLLTACVHDDKYNNPDLQAYQCKDQFDGYKTITLDALKKMGSGTKITEKLLVEGYVSSSDETGNIYKYIYIQDKPENPTQGLVISVDAVNTYANYPQGSKISITLDGLSLGTYGNFIQLGENSSTTGVFGRITESTLPKKIFKSCTTPKATIKPLVMKLADFKTANDQYVGCLVQIDNAEFDKKTLCMQYAPEGISIDRQINDPNTTLTTRVVRNSGYATFANKNLPSGNGKFVGILSKFNSSYQFYIVNDSDLDMKGPRLDKLTATCQVDASATPKTVAQVKEYYKGSLYQITENATLKAKVVGNDAAGNLFKKVYVEDETGGIAVNINVNDLFLDRRFQIGRTVTIGLKDLYINDKNGEVQLGALFQGNVGQVNPEETYKHFFRTDRPITTVTPTVKKINELTKADIGRYIRIKDLQFIETDLGKTYAEGTNTTARTLEDCSGNKTDLTTSGYADFGTRDFPFKASSTDIDTGKGDVTGILSYYNGKYQIWILNLRGADLDNPRCDGTTPVPTATIFKEGFDNLSNWTTVNVLGTQTWTTTNFGNPRPSAFLDGSRQANEDWLVSKPIALSGYSDPFFSFETDGRFNGNPLEVYVTENYTGNVATTTWAKATNAVYDTDLDGFAGFVSSGKISLKAYEGKSVVIAFKYTSVAGASVSWELDNVIVRGVKK